MWTIDTDGVLRISGTGAMDDYTAYGFSSAVLADYFTYRSSIKSIVVEEGITYIGEYAMQYLSTATSVSIPSTVTSIGKGAFWTCSKITTVTVPETVEILGTGVFQECYALASASLPSHLTEIPGGTFCGCRALTSVEIPSGVTSIGPQAFASTALTSVTLPIGLQTIKGSAFVATDLTEVVIPAGVTSIGMSAFSSCDSLTAVYFYGDLPESGGSVFTTNGMTIYYLPGTAGWTTANVTGIFIDSIYTYTLKEWGASSGTCGTNVNWTLDSKGVLTISGSGAMTDFSGSDMPWHTMKDGILEVVVEEGVTSIGDFAFKSYTNLKTVILPEGLTKIGESAFESCTALKEISVPDTVTEMEQFAFQGCSRMQSAKLSANLTSIAWGLFYDCSALEKIEIPAAVETMDMWAFYSCESLEEVTFASGSKLTSIGESAFHGSGVVTINLPDSVVSMGRNAFCECEELTSVTLPANLTQLSEYAFAYCTSLTSVELPESVTEIGEGAFLATGLTGITIPTAVTKIGAVAFGNCTALTDAYFNGVKPEFSTYCEDAKLEDSYAFLGDTYNLHFPYGANGWSEDNLSDVGGTYTLMPEGVASGTCGTSVTWTMGQNGEMLIGGSGAMEDYTLDAPAPWDNVKDDIISVEIGGAVTGIGARAFCNCRNLTSVALGKNVASVGAEAFRDSQIASFLFEGDMPEVAENSYSFAVYPGMESVLLQYHEGRTGWGNVTIAKLGGVPVDLGYDDSVYEFVMENHDWHNEKHTKDATCTSLAERTYTCAICQNTKTETYGSLASHTAGSWITTKAATCTAKGEKVQKCTACGTLLDTDVINAKGHSWGSWTTVSAATVFDPKKEKRTCSTCTTTESRSTGTKLEGTIKVNVTEIPLKVGQSTTVVKVSGLANGDYIKSWESNKPGIATVNNSGKITGKKKGTAIIRITLASNKRAEVKVKVQKAAVKAKYISIVGYTKYTLEKNKKLDLLATNQPTVYPLTAAQKFTFTSSNKKVATVNSKGVVTAKAGGTAKITMKSGSAKKWTFTITVPKIKTKEITGAPENLILQKKGKTYWLDAEKVPKNSEETMTYKSSNKKVLTVSSKGKIKVLKKGTAVITIKSGSVTFKVNVTVI